MARVLMMVLWPERFCRKLPRGSFHFLMLSAEHETKVNSVGCEQIARTLYFEGEFREGGKDALGPSMEHVAAEVRSSSSSEHFISSEIMTSRPSARLYPSSMQMWGWRSGPRSSLVGWYS